VCGVLYVGAGENEKTLGFYKKNGFEYSHRVKDFFTDNYDHTIMEDGKVLRDMIYLKRELKG
jgi:ribosomal protein S18 acetylase RimI-like enzyme